MTNKEKFLNLVSDEESNILEQNRWRIANRNWLRASQDVALKILMKLDDLGWSQKILAEKLNVSPQYISKVVKGKENLTLETLVRLQEVLNIPLLASFYEKTNTDNGSITKKEELFLEENLFVATA